VVTARKRNAVELVSNLMGPGPIGPRCWRWWISSRSDSCRCWPYFSLTIVGAHALPAHDGFELPMSVATASSGWLLHDAGAPDSGGVANARDGWRRTHDVTEKFTRLGLGLTDADFFF